MARNSLTSRRDFRRVFSLGRRSGDAGITVIGIQSVAPEGPSRVGLVVPGSAGTAVARNRIRRRVKAALAQVQPADGFDIVVRTDERAGRIQFQELVGDLSRALAGAGIECTG